MELFSACFPRRRPFFSKFSRSKSAPTSTTTAPAVSSTEKANGGSTVFNAQTINHSYWDIYLAHRPTYSPSFYEIIYNYHRDIGNNSWHLAKDIGTGPGNVAAILSPKFDKIHASDPGATHVEVAKERLARDGIQNVNVYQSTAEKLLSAGVTKPNTVDLLAVAEAMPLMDARTSLDSFAQITAKGGTLAIWFYGRPIFVDPLTGGVETTRAARCQRIFDEICIRAYSRIRPMKGTHWEVASSTLFSWLDNVELPEDTWGKVRRYKWNADRPLAFYDEAACDHSVVTKHVQRRDGDEQRIDVVDRSFWGKEWGINEVKEFIGVLLPQFTENLSEEIAKDGFYDELERAMGGQGASMKISWPVVLILATKK
ncbi:MAG: hypothetical protein M1820_010464 [Bogoriella megaspora]|nr:MAG: hypothetical protein M1820_010464 [Bogoriella megaspora]